MINPGSLGTKKFTSEEAKGVFQKRQIKKIQNTVQTIFIQIQICFAEISTKADKGVE